MSDIAVLEGAEEFEIGEGSVGALLVHGFTGSPQGMRALGDHLAANGMAATGVRLPGHGTTWQDLSARTHEEWAGAVEEGYDKLAGRCDTIFVVGLSFGSALAIDFTARNPEKVSGVVLLASYIMTKDPRRFLAPAVRLVVQSLPGVGNDIADPDMREIVYDRVPTKAAYSMLQFIRGARAKLPRVSSHSYNAFQAGSHGTSRQRSTHFRRDRIVGQRAGLARALVSRHNRRLRKTTGLR